MHVAEREQAELVEAVGVAVGVEPAVVVITAPVADLGEVAEGGGAGGVAEGVCSWAKVTGAWEASTGTSKSGERRGIMGQYIPTGRKIAIQSHF